MSNIINKVIVHKLDNITPEFEATFKAAFDTTKDLFNEMVCWGNDSVHTKTDVVDLVKQRKDLYEKTDKSIYYDQFQDLLFVMYQCFIYDGNNGRGLVSSIIGNPQTTDCITDYAYLHAIAEKFHKLNDKEAKKLAKTCSKEKFSMLIGNTLKAIGYKNRKPYTNIISPSDKYGVVGNVYRMLTSWEECNKSAYQNYHKDIDEINFEINKFNDDEQTLIEGFVSFCLIPIDAKNPDSCIVKHFNPCIRSYLKDCIIPALQQGTTPTKHFRLDNKENKIPYSLHQDFITYLQNNPDLWQGPDPLILKSLYILEMQANHEKHQDHATFPFITDENMRKFQYILGDNYNSYEFNATGDDISDTQVSVSRFNDTVDYNFINGHRVDSLAISFKNKIKDIKDEEYKLKIYTKDLRYNGTYDPNPYFKDLEVWTTDTKKCTNLFRFTHKGETVQGLIKEPAIVNTGDAYEIRLNMTVVVDDNTVVESLAWFMSTAYPSSKSSRAKIKDTQKNQERINLLKGKTFNLLGVDLGQRTPFAYAVGQTTITGMVNDLTILAEGEYEHNDSTLSQMYWDTLNILKNTSKVIGITKSIKKQLDNNETPTPKFDHFISNLIEKAQAYFKSTQHHHSFTTKKKNAFEKITNQTTGQILSDLISQVKKYDLKDLKANPNWIGMYLVKFCQLTFTKTKKERQYYLKENSTHTKHDYEFNWLKCIELYKRIQRASFYMGTDPLNRPEINLNNVNKYFEGVKDNFLKVIAASIVSKALDHDCKVIVLEDLNNSRSKLNKSQENFMTSLWSPKRIQDAIENAANWHGIKVITVSESCTSQIHYETGKFGYRPKKGCETLYYEDDDGNIKTTHADINAAKNIILNAVTRHASIRQVYLKREFDENTAKRVQGFLTYKFGNVKTGIEEIIKEVGDDTNFAYLHGNKWISQETKNEIIKAIKSKKEEMENENK